MLDLVAATLRRKHDLDHRPVDHVLPEKNLGQDRLQRQETAKPGHDDDAGKHGMPDEPPRDRQVQAFPATQREHQAEASGRTSFAGLDVAFHNEIASIGGNRILCVFIGSLNAQISDMIEHNLALEGAGEDAVSYHEKITEAIAAGSPERASELMRNHILIFMRNAEQGQKEAKP